MIKTFNKNRFVHLILFVFIVFLKVNSTPALAQQAAPMPASETSPWALASFISAVQSNAMRSVEPFLSKGVDINALDQKAPHNSALHWAVWSDATQVLELLLKQKNIVVDTLNGAEETPLMIAALKGNVRVVKQLLAAGAYPNKEGWTALHYAATNGHVEIMQLLLDAHAYIDAESPNKTTPLMMAAKSKNIFAVKLLLDEGAELSLKNELGWDAHKFAVHEGAVEIAAGLASRASKLKVFEERSTKDKEK